MPASDRSAAEQSLFVTLVELRPLQGCELNPDEFAGAMTRGYVMARSLREAVDRFETALTLLKFELSDMDWCGKADVIDWEEDDAPDDRNLKAEAAQSGEVVFGTFSAWEHDAKQ